MVNHHHHNKHIDPADLDPLIINVIPTKGIIINKRDYRINNLPENYGRLRICIISICLFLLVYVCFTIGLWTDQKPQIIVNIPPFDRSLPGPPALQLPTFIDEIEMTPPTKTTITTTTTTMIINNLLINNSSINFKKNSYNNNNNHNNQTVPVEYLVFSPGCQMPALDPLAADVMKLFKQEKYEECSVQKPLTTIRRNFTTDSAHLILDEKLKSTYAIKHNKITCCYQEINRAGDGKYADDKFSFSTCIEFYKTIELPPTIEFILVKCKSGGKTVYTNGHAIVRNRLALRKKLTEYHERYQDKHRPLSVLMLSIDSISRLNLIRAMPKTAQHLYDTGWYELQGYNKIDDNTFPNLMAILVGYNSSLAYNECLPTKPGRLEQCPFVWEYFRNNGYVTGYGEDEASISTFNYHKTGFIKQPTDFYLRPFMLAAEKHLHIKRKHSLTFCLGYKHSADHIYDYALDFASTYKHDPYFGLFWANTFSHNDISDPSSMDQKMKQYILELEKREILQNNMVVFFSDHGIRFGPVRHLVTGWLEERLPFIFIWLPKWFRDSHPEIVESLKINRNRLTNPYDLHMTLKHILELSERATVDATEHLPKALSCPNCQSLFRVMPWDRSCNDTAIAGHWCTCSPYKNIPSNHPNVVRAVKIVINHMNSELETYANSSSGSGGGTKNQCATLKYKTISYARRAEFRNETEPYDDYMFVFEAAPSNGWFESTVRYYTDLNKMEVTGSVSRLDMYSTQSACMKIDYLKKFCYCTQKNSKKGRR